MKKIILVLFLISLFSCEKTKFKINEDLVGTWNIYFNSSQETQFMTIDQKSISFFEFGEFSNNYKITDFEQIGNTYPVQIILRAKSKTESVEFNFVLINDKELHNSTLSPTLNYFKL